MTPFPDQTHRKRRDEMLGILLMAAAMLIIPTSDAIAKYLSGSHSPAFLSWVRYVAALGFILPVALLQHARAPGPAFRPASSPRWKRLTAASRHCRVSKPPC